MRSATNSSSSLCSADVSPDSCGLQECLIHFMNSLYGWRSLCSVPNSSLWCLLFETQTNLTSKNGQCLFRQTKTWPPLAAAHAWELAQWLPWLQSVTIQTVPCRERQGRAGMTLADGYNSQSRSSLGWRRTQRHLNVGPLPATMELQHFFCVCVFLFLWGFNGTQNCGVDSVGLSWFSVATIHYGRALRVQTALSNSVCRIDWNI